MIFEILKRNQDDFESSASLLNFGDYSVKDCGIYLRYSFDADLIDIPDYVFSNIGGYIEKSKIPLLFDWEGDTTIRVYHAKDYPKMIKERGTHLKINWERQLEIILLGELDSVINQ